MKVGVHLQIRAHPLHADHGAALAAARPLAGQPSCRTPAPCSKGDSSTKAGRFALHTLEHSVTEPRPLFDPAFRALFDAHSAYVIKTLRRLGVRPGDLEDLMHELFLTVLRKWDTYDASRPPKPWLFTFARSLAYAYRNSAYVRRESFEEAEPPPTSSAEELLAERQESTLVYRALDTLDDDKRIVFTMFELDERTAADIAAELGIPQNTVFSRLRAAREEFARAAKRLSHESPRHPTEPQEPAHAERA